LADPQFPEEANYFPLMRGVGRGLAQLSVCNVTTPLGDTHTAINDNSQSNQRELSHWRELFRTLAGCTDAAYPNSKAC